MEFLYKNIRAVSFVVFNSMLVFTIVVTGVFPEIGDRLFWDRNNSLDYIFKFSVWAMVISNAWFCIFFYLTKK